MRKVVIIALVLCVLLACGSSRKVYRIEPETTTDLSGKWNDTDARLVAEEMIADCLARVWLTDFAAAAGRKPVVTVGTLRNRSSEHIDTETFTTDFERELTNSGQVKFVASPDQRDEIRDERLDQQEWASAETMKRIRAETGADFILVGGIKSITDQVEGTKVVYYQTDLELVNIESMEKAWIGTKKIKKEISKSKTKW
jgi:uncharacterized protein (TIGR02722 family)